MPSPAGRSEAVVAALRRGEAAIVPTDTVYGLAVSPLHAETPEILYRIKGRPSSKPVAWLVAERGDLETYGHRVPAYARALADAFWPGALTLIVQAGDAVPPAYRSQAGTIGLRMPDSITTRAIARAVGNPLAVSSANLSGGPDPMRFADLDPAIVDQAAACIHGSAEASGVASTVVDCTGAAPRILRLGQVSQADIDACIAERS